MALLACGRILSPSFAESAPKVMSAVTREMHCNALSSSRFPPGSHIRRANCYSLTNNDKRKLTKPGGLSLHLDGQAEVGQLDGRALLLARQQQILGLKRKNSTLVWKKYGELVSVPIQQVSIRYYVLNRECLFIYPPKEAEGSLKALKSVVD